MIRLKSEIAGCGKRLGWLAYGLDRLQPDRASWSNLGSNPRGDGVDHGYDAFSTILLSSTASITTIAVCEASKIAVKRSESLCRSSIVRSPF